ncbi:MAG: hypothetical protein ACJAXB_002890 [Candidatus Endobugula sp.]|jgi:hypothetical protein
MKFSYCNRNNEVKRLVGEEIQQGEKTVLWLITAQ